MLAGVLIRNHCQVTLQHISGETNVICDLLSRKQVDSLDPQYDPQPTKPDLNFQRSF